MASPDPQLVVAVLCEEYRALYSLLVFRLTAMEQRLPVIAAVLSVFVGGSAVAPPPVQPLVFLAVPIAVVWFVHTTVGHARSKEDVKERLAAIEREVCEIVGCHAMVFQLSHPSRGRIIGGRSGRHMIVFVVGVAIALLASALFLPGAAGFAGTAGRCYAAFVGVAALVCIGDAWLLQRYHPRPTPALTVGITTAD